MYAIAQRCLKLNTAALAALLVTFSLFYLMQVLIQIDDDRPQAVFPIAYFDATMPEFKSIVIEPVNAPEPLELEEIVDTSPETRSVDPGTGPAVPLIKVDPRVDIPTINKFGLGQSEMIPLVRTVAPYPNRALQNHVEGFVVVEFTVTELGTVADARVIYAEPEGYFERAALQTISKWRYAAKVENGKPMPVTNVQQRIVFEITN